jgi:hypothetical protein
MRLKTLWWACTLLAITFHDIDSWKLVHFVRHLSALTPEELQEIRRLDPKKPG